MSAEPLLAAAYALFLVGAALGLDLLARHSHARSDQYRTLGFEYRPDHDLWVCPEGEHLRLVETDHHRRLARYRARARVCNECPSKEACTDSSAGREISRPLDPWPHSEAGRFHRGIATAICGLGALVAAAALVRNHEPGHVVLLAPIATLTMVVLLRLGSSFMRTPSGFSSTIAGEAEAPQLQSSNAPPRARAR